MSDAPGEVELKMTLDQVRDHCHTAVMQLQQAKSIADEYGFTGWVAALYSAQRDITGVMTAVARHAEDHLSPSVRR